MIADPEAPGRGPRWMGSYYRWERDDDLPVVGRFAGVALGTRKGADTLFVDVGRGNYIGIRYEHLVSAIAVDECPNCERYSLLRQSLDEWACSGCGYRDVRMVDDGE